VGGVVGDGNVKPGLTLWTLALIAVSAREAFVANAVVRRWSAASALATASNLSWTRRDGGLDEPTVTTLANCSKPVAREVVVVAATDARRAVTVATPRAQQVLLGTIDGSCECERRQNAWGRVRES
jgi:hypothetical protein